MHLSYEASFCTYTSRILCSAAPSLHCCFSCITSSLPRCSSSIAYPACAAPVLSSPNLPTKPSPPPTDFSSLICIVHRHLVCSTPSSCHPLWVCPDSRCRQNPCTAATQCNRPATRNRNKTQNEWPKNSTSLTVQQDKEQCCRQYTGMHACMNYYDVK